MEKHIADIHLPLECKKCSKVFKTLESLIEIEKCCETMFSDENGNEAAQAIDEDIKNEKFSYQTRRWLRKSWSTDENEPKMAKEERGVQE